MPLRQSTIKFAFSPSTLNNTMAPRAFSRTGKESSRLIPDTSVDTDTVTVDIVDIPQLPTPSESATDVSSQSSQSGESKQLPRSRSKRVSSVRRSRFVEDVSNPADTTTEEKNRSLSGETLVDSMKNESGQAQDGIKALNLPWDMSDVFEKVNNPTSSNSNDETTSEAGSIITVPDLAEHDEVEEVDELERAKQNAAKKAKMQENAQRWAERNKAAEENATRRSKRASLLSKAGDIISDITGTVLGKRSREIVDKSRDRLSELRSSMKPQSASTNEEDVGEN